MKSKVLIGTSGFSYSDWKDVFYPSDLRQADRLDFYADRFSVLELNYTYYRMPAARNIANMVNKTGDKMIYSVKAHKDFTHGDMQATEFKEFLKALEPMRERGVLGSILFQFPYRFKNAESAWDRIEAFAGILDGDTGVVEFRHQSWIEEQTFQRLSGLNLAFCCVDEPDMSGLPGKISAVTASTGYIRFHGRNKESWWEHKQAWERYNYHYKPEELKEWIPIIRKMRSNTDRIFVFFNNHYQGQAISNAQMLMAFLDE